MLIQLNGGWTSWAAAHRSDVAEMSEMDLNMASSVSVERPMCVSSLARRRFSFSSVFCCELRVNVEQMWSERGEVSVDAWKQGRARDGKPTSNENVSLCVGSRHVVDILNVYNHRKYPHMRRKKRARFRAEETRTERELTRHAQATGCAQAAVEEEDTDSHPPLRLLPVLSNRRSVPTVVVEGLGDVNENKDGGWDRFVIAARSSAEGVDGVEEANGGPLRSKFVDEDYSWEHSDSEASRPARPARTARTPWT